MKNSLDSTKRFTAYYSWRKKKWSKTQHSAWNVLYTALVIPTFSVSGVSSSTSPQDGVAFSPSNRMRKVKSWPVLEKPSFGDADVSSKSGKYKEKSDWKKKEVCSFLRLYAVTIWIIYLSFEVQNLPTWQNITTDNRPDDRVSIQATWFPEACSLLKFCRESINNVVSVVFDHDYWSCGVYQRGKIGNC